MEGKILMEKLMRKESPFSWKIPDVMDIPVQNFITNQISKFQQIEEENEFKWSRFILGLLLSYELCEKNQDYDEALSYITWCKNHLQKLKNEDCKEPLFASLYKTLVNITNNTEAIILLRSGQGERAIKLIENQRQLFESHPASLLGTKAAVFLQYGTTGHRMALKAAEQARDLDPDQGEWWFLIGNALGRIRRTENGSITPEEINAIEKAFALEKNASYIVNLAQLYGEYSSQSFFSQNYERAKIYAKKAVFRYREAIELRPTCVLLKVRVAHGMLRIRIKDEMDIPFAKQLLDEVVKSTPENSMVHHDLGYYYERFGNNSEEALCCLKRSSKLGNIKAAMYMISLKWKHGKKDEIIEDILEWLDMYKSIEGQAQLLVYLGVCHVLIKDDWEPAIESFQKSLGVDPSAKYFVKFQGFYGKNVNLLELVTNHLYHSEVKENLKNPEMCKKFLDSVKKLKPDIQPSVTAKSKYSFMEWKKEMMEWKKNANKGSVRWMKARNNY